MKLEDIKVPQGFVIRGYETPKEGDYILCPDNTFDVNGASYNDIHHFCIILDRIWKPQVGKYYEFSDYADFPVPIVRKYVGNHTKENGECKYKDETSETWRYIRPIQEVRLGK